MRFLLPRPQIWFTLGPSSLDIIPDLLQAGATGLRLTYSFGTPELQSQRAFRAKQAAADHSVDLLVVADLPGEKTRVGEYQQDTPFTVEAGQEIQLGSAPKGDPHLTGVLPISDAQFFTRIGVGDDLIFGDGDVVLLVTDVQPKMGQAHASVIGPGPIEATRGVTVRSSAFVPRSLTQRDQKSLDSILGDPNIDMIALSFVSAPETVVQLRRRMSEFGRDLPIVAKIETQEGVRNIEDIADVADVLMAARGDLALSSPWEELYRHVMRISSAAQIAGTPWLVATQIIERQSDSSIPSRAEICDLSHWLTLGAAHGAMLTYETAFGPDPVNAVTAVRKLCKAYAESAGGRSTKQPAPSLSAVLGQ